MRNEFEKEWDDKMAAHLAEHLADLRKGQLIAFKAFAKEIKDYQYTTIAQVNGALAGHIERLKGIEYEADARADHITENQFNGKV